MTLTKMFSASAFTRKRRSRLNCITKLTAQLNSYGSGRHFAAYKCHDGEDEDNQGSCGGKSRIIKCEYDIHNLFGFLKGADGNGRFGHYHHCLSESLENIQ
jgi:hypothetical protein